MTVFDFDASPTLIESDDTNSSWFLIPEPGVSNMPYSTDFELGGETWFIEYEVIRGRLTDFVMFHLFQVINGTPTPVIDTKLVTGLQINVDEKIRIYGYKINPFLQDNYLREKAGTYQIMISEVV
jgi:hypothetical protein